MYFALKPQAAQGAGRTIDGKGETVRELLNAKRYSIDYDQGNTNGKPSKSAS
jgi:hypothetical protein